MKRALTLTVVANMTANYSEGLGNISSVQKVFRGGKVYSSRTKESLKNALMVQSGMYNDLDTDAASDSSKKVVVQKNVNAELNASNCRALEGGYMNTKGSTTIRNSSFYVTDAVSCESFVNETRFHNNLYLATAHAKKKNINLQNNASEAGLMPYQYEYSKDLRIYSLTIDLEMIGKDKNFEGEEGYKEADATEKAARVNALLDAVQNLSLVVKGNLDNAEPLFIVGGLSDRKTHYFENAVRVKEGKLVLSNELNEKLSQGFKAGLMENDVFINEDKIIQELSPISVNEFFSDLKKQVVDYYNN